MPTGPVSSTPTCWLWWPASAILPALDGLDLRTRLEQEQARQAWLARHDPLTGLPNRTALNEHLE
ncbi:protein of unknown function [Candidatus Hydrogenisulfobacillus filiaventi]|uniref:Uncharacterized protein n=1 Tax=Candidatus Hydrogenisulfobacillus filiaventi TaxID=2707344 RepID=A0A6F8ZFU3_9FIRM|nr:GGDEF domain-containing protein [Bacillota bacterium]CAB1128618.1 protein of unknown function [Candidatus Hydrogenisulfobacillus filiaventi]